MKTLDIEFVGSGDETIAGVLISPYEEECESVFGIRENLHISTFATCEEGDSL